MKRAISFLATLMLAFLVSFGFVVNNASAAVHNCDLTKSRPCSQLLKAGDVLNVGFYNTSSIDVIYQSLAFSMPVVVNPTIGSSPFPPVNLAPRQIKDSSYSTTGQTGAVFENTATVTGGNVALDLIAR